MALPCGLLQFGHSIVVFRNRQRISLTHCPLSCPCFTEERERRVTFRETTNNKTERAVEVASDASLSPAFCYRRYSWNWQQTCCL